MKVRWAILSVATELPKPQKSESGQSPAGHGETPPTGRRPGEMRPIVVLSIFILSLSSAILLGYSLRRGQHEAPVSVTAPASQQTAAPAPRAISAPTPERAPAPKELVKFPLTPRGKLVLQVAALTSQHNARTMAEELQQRGFPAFVRPPSTDHFHRVQVGPYSDRESAKIAKQELEKAGYTVIVKH